VTLVARDDLRLVGDIEKLLKKKIEIEPFELEDDRPRRFRRRDEDDGPREAASAMPARAPAAAYERPRRASLPGDPIFDKPYEPAATAAAGAPAWETAPKPATTPVRGLSPNIRAKKKVASLLGG